MRKFLKIAAPALIAAMGLGAAMPASAATPYHQMDRKAPAREQVRVKVDVNRGDSAREHARFRRGYREGYKARVRFERHHRWDHRREEHRRFEHRDERR